MKTKYNVTYIALRDLGYVEYFCSCADIQTQLQTNRHTSKMALHVPYSNMRMINVYISEPNKKLSLKECHMWKFWEYMVLYIDFHLLRSCMVKGHGAK